MGDDLYYKKDLNKMTKHNLAILGYEVSDPTRFGMIKTNDYGNMVDVIEKPKRCKSKLANTGVYVLDRRFFKYDLAYIGNGEFGLPQTLAKMAKNNKIKVERASLWHPIGNAEDLKSAEQIIHKLS